MSLELHLMIFIKVQCNIHDNDILPPNDINVLHIFKNWSGTVGKQGHWGGNRGPGGEH